MSIEHCSQPIPTDKDGMDADHRRTTTLKLSLEIFACVNHALIINSELYRKLQLRLEQTYFTLSWQIVYDILYIFLQFILLFMLFLLFLEKTEKTENIDFLTKIES